VGDRLTPRAWLALYFASVVAISFIHEPVILAVLLAGGLIAAGRQAWSLIRRTVLAVLSFNLAVSLGYVVVALWQGNFQGSYLLLVNLRVGLMVFLGFWLVSRVDLLAALRGFPLLRMIATLAVSQIKTFERVARDFRLAFQSRNLIRPGLRDQARHAAAQAQTLLDKSMASAGEAALAMRSRGTFDD
jgi:cobalt/nickel transport system permease protein